MIDFQVPFRRVGLLSWRAPKETDIAGEYLIPQSPRRHQFDEGNVNEADLVEIIALGLAMLAFPFFDFVEKIQRLCFPRWVLPLLHGEKLRHTVRPAWLLIVDRLLFFGSETQRLEVCKQFARARLLPEFVHLG